MDDLGSREQQNNEGLGVACVPVCGWPCARVVKDGEEFVHPGGC